MSEEILALCKSRGVGFSLTYAESDDTWWGSINSVAKAECLVTKNGSLEMTLLRLKEHLESIGETNWIK